MTPAQLDLLAAPPSSILAHPRWPEIRQWARVERGPRGHLRFELKHPPPAELPWLLRVQVRCVACGDPIHPVRSRMAPGNKRSENLGHGLFLCVSCPLSVRVGCSRGKAARDECLRLEFEVISHKWTDEAAV